MSALEEHQMYCENEDCGCADPPAKNECLNCRARTRNNDHFCSDLCGMTWARDNGVPYIEEEVFRG